MGNSLKSGCETESHKESFKLKKRSIPKEGGLGEAKRSGETLGTRGGKKYKQRQGDRRVEHKAGEAGILKKWSP